MHYISEVYAVGEKPTNQQLIKEENIKLLFSLISRNHELARADLVRMTGLSPTTVSVLVDELVQENLVVETGYANTMQTGRKPINLRINSAGRQIPVFSFNRKGVQYTLYDLEMAPIESICVEYDISHYDGFSSSAKPHPNVTADYVRILRDVLLSRSKHFQPEHALAICLNYPGIHNPQSGNQAITSTSLNVLLDGNALIALERELQIPFFFGNTSQSFAYAERGHLIQLGENVDDLIYVNVCDGLGAGIISNGRVVTGTTGSAGEIGHVTINFNGRPCHCGGRGCLEQYVSQKIIIEQAYQIANFYPVRTFIQMNNGELKRPTLRMIGAAYEAGEREIVDALNTIAAQLFAGIYSVVCTTGINRVIIGGGIEELGMGFLNQLRSHAKRSNASPIMRDMTFSYSSIPASQGGIGVAQYFLDHQFIIDRKSHIGN